MPMTPMRAANMQRCWAELRQSQSQRQQPRQRHPLLRIWRSEMDLYCATLTSLPQSACCRCRCCCCWGRDPNWHLIGICCWLRRSTASAATARPLLTLTLTVLPLPLLCGDAAARRLPPGWTPRCGDCCVGADTRARSRSCSAPCLAERGEREGEGGRELMQVEVDFDWLLV